MLETAQALDNRNFIHDFLILELMKIKGNARNKHLSFKWFWVKYETNKIIGNDKYLLGKPIF